MATAMIAVSLAPAGILTLGLEYGLRILLDMANHTTAIAMLLGTVLAVTGFPSSADAQVRTTAGLGPFVASTFGNQRRTFESESALVTLSALVSTIKGGLQVPVRPGFMIAPGGGIDVNLERRVTSAFAEIEVNHTFRTGGYAGTGVGVWDLGERGHTAATVLIHFGAPLILRAPRTASLLVTFDSRLFFGQLNNIDNNYQALVGLRYVFR